VVGSKSERKITESLLFCDDSAGLRSNISIILTSKRHLSKDPHKKEKIDEEAFQKELLYSK
jgi:hypothetical protein